MAVSSTIFFIKFRGAYDSKAKIKLYATMQNKYKAR